jgi:hypothetical protein
MDEDKDKSEKELLIDIKEILESKNSNFTNQLLRANNEISSEIQIRLNWIFGILIGILGALYFLNN